MTAHSVRGGTESATQKGTPCLFTAAHPPIISLHLTTRGPARVCSGPRGSAALLSRRRSTRSHQLASPAAGGASTAWRWTRTEWRRRGRRQARPRLRSGLPPRLPGLLLCCSHLRSTAPVPFVRRSPPASCPHAYTSANGSIATHISLQAARRCGSGAFDLMPCHASPHQGFGVPLCCCLPSSP